MKVEMPEGFCCRVAAIANALAQDGGAVMHWRENGHCPFPWRSVFPSGIPGVELLDSPVDLKASLLQSHMAWNWHAFGDPDRTLAAYRVILDSMVGSAAASPPQAAFHFRAARSPWAQPSTVGRQAASVLSRHGFTGAFLMADSMRDEIAASLTLYGISVEFPASREMASDLDREASDMTAFLSDWKTLLGADFIVTAAQKSAMLYPAYLAKTSVRTVAGNVVLSPYSKP